MTHAIAHCVGDSDRVGNPIGSMGLELELTYRRLLSSYNQLVFDDVAVPGFGDLAGRDEPEQFLGDHYGLTAMPSSSSRTMRESLAEAGMSLHVTVNTVTQYLRWHFVQKRGQILVLELGVLLVGRSMESG